MCRQTRRISSCISARVGSDSVRSVPSMNAVSGITLLVVPATICAMVSTAGWWASTRRVRAVCSAPTIAAAAGTGSSASCGAEACPPRPVTVTRIASAAAISGPRPGVQLPGRQGRADVQRVRGVRPPARPVPVQQPLVDHVRGRRGTPPPRAGTSAPPAPRAARAGRRAAGRRWRASRRACRARRRASRRRPRSGTAGPVSSCRGSASMSARSSTVEPGRAPSSTATTDVVARPWCTCSGRSASAATTASRVRGRSSPSSGCRCRARRSATVRGCSLRACSPSPASKGSAERIA